MGYNAKFQNAPMGKRPVASQYGDRVTAMWFLIQGLIIFAVCATNIHWRWTPNPYLPAFAGLLLAWLVTLAIVTVQGS